jgi:hypothetical protein
MNGSFSTLRVMKFITCCDVLNFVQSISGAVPCRPVCASFCAMHCVMQAVQRFIDRSGNAVIVGILLHQVIQRGIKIADARIHRLHRVGAVRSPAHAAIICSSALTDFAVLLFQGVDERRFNFLIGLHIIRNSGRVLVAQRLRIRRRRVDFSIHIKFGNRSQVGKLAIDLHHIGRINSLFRRRGPGRLSNGLLFCWNMAVKALGLAEVDDGLRDLWPLSVLRLYEPAIAIETHPLKAIRDCRLGLINFLLPCPLFLSSIIRLNPEKCQKTALFMPYASLSP